MPGKLTKLASSPEIFCVAISIARSRSIRGGGEPSADSGTASRDIAGMIFSVEMEIWLSNSNAWIRNQVPVMEITAMNQIDQMPLKR
ncbi:hypothetical protein D9M71_653980 [compost metagenome]